LLKPAVRAFYCTQTRGHIAPVDIDLARTPSYRVVADESPERWGVDPMHFLEVARHSALSRLIACLRPSNKSCFFN